MPTTGPPSSRPWRPDPRKPHPRGPTGREQLGRGQPSGRVLRPGRRRVARRDPDRGRRERLRRAADGVRAGVRFLATNLDPTYPGAEGLLPGAGALVAAVATAGGRRPEVAGKPEPAMAALVRARYGNPVVMVGDRPSTDG